MPKHIHLNFPRNRLFPPLVESDTWAISTTTLARIVRVAPKSSFPAHTGMVIKVLRGETNEVPTPLAPCKACRSCKCPDYLNDVIAGSEGAILLVCWAKGTAGDLAALEEKAVEVQYEPSRTSSDDAQPNIVESFAVCVEEGETYVGDVQFFRSLGGTESKLKTYDNRDEGLFGEIAVAIDGMLKVSWTKLGEETTRILKVPAGYEYGPFYAVDADGHLERSGTGQLIYAPHKYVVEESSTWATVRLPVVKSDVAGPHRHCYT